ncbi:MAG: hypothetical protein HXY50_17115 [Ignavibacteriaceae bacterium]|nr:hypothetical protein [Ignavibacteriaceae bacterium]
MHAQRRIGRLLSLALIVGSWIGFAQATAQTFRPGDGVFVASGGASSTGQAEVISSIGQILSGVGTSEPWSLWTGILVPYSLSLELQITPNAPPFSTAGQPITIEALVASEGPVQSASLHYRMGGQRGYASLPMVAGQLDGWTATIPAGAVTLRGVEYYIEVRAAGREAHSPPASYEDRPWTIPVHVSDSNGDGALATMARVYRMVSIPALMPEGTTAAITDDLGPPDPAVWRCGAWNPTTETYLEVGSDAVEPFTPGRAVWLITRDASMIDFVGSTVFPVSENGWPIPLLPGWNQIGCPYAYSVALQDLLIQDGAQTLTLGQAVAAGLVEAQPLHEYDGTAYQTSDTEFAPWTGYFVANLTPRQLSLIVPAREMTLAAKRNPAQNPPAPDWLLTASHRDADGNRAMVDLGIAAGAEEGSDQWDLLLPPPAPGCRTTLCSYNKEFPEPLRSLCRDVRGPSASGIAWTLTVSSGESGPIELAWEASGELPAGFSMRLIDPSRGAWVGMDRSGAHTVLSPEAGVLSLIVAVGTTEWLDQQSEASGLPGQHLDASIMGGNPGSGVIDVRVVLRRSEELSLQAYDVHGRLLRSVLSGRMGPGIQVLHWDARSDEGRAVPSGIYFLRISGGEREVRLRSVLIR